MQKQKKSVSRKAEVLTRWYGFDVGGEDETSADDGLSAVNDNFCSNEKEQANE